MTTLKAHKSDKLTQDATTEIMQLGETALMNKDPLMRSRASEALGSLGDFRAEHAAAFSQVIKRTPGHAESNRPDSRCGTADIIRQHRAVAALRDLGTAAQPHRQMLHSVQEGSRDPALQDAARRAKFDAEILSPKWETGKRRVSLGNSASLPAITHWQSTADLRASADEMRMTIRCTTPAGHRSEDMLFRQIQMMETTMFTVH